MQQARIPLFEVAFLPRPDHRDEAPGHQHRQHGAFGSRAAPRIRGHAGAGVVGLGEAHPDRTGRKRRPVVLEPVADLPAGHLTAQQGEQVDAGLIVVLEVVRAMIDRAEELAQHRLLRTQTLEPELQPLQQREHAQTGVGGVIGDAPIPVRLFGMRCIDAVAIDLELVRQAQGPAQHVVVVRLVGPVERVGVVPSV